MKNRQRQKSYSLCTRSFLRFFSSASSTNWCLDIILHRQSSIEITNRSEIGWQEQIDRRINHFIFQRKTKKRKSLKIETNERKTSSYFCERNASLINISLCLLGKKNETTMITRIDDCVRVFLFLQTIKVKLFV